MYLLTVIIIVEILSYLYCDCCIKVPLFKEGEY